MKKCEIVTAGNYIWCHFWITIIAQLKRQKILYDTLSLKTYNKKFICKSKKQCKSCASVWYSCSRCFLPGIATKISAPLSNMNCRALPSPTRRYSHVTPGLLSSYLKSSFKQCLIKNLSVSFFKVKCTYFPNHQLNSFYFSKLSK